MAAFGFSYFRLISSTMRELGAMKLLRIQPVVMHIARHSTFSAIRGSHVVSHIRSDVSILALNN